MNFTLSTFGEGQGVGDVGVTYLEDMGVVPVVPYDYSLMPGNGSDHPAILLGGSGNYLDKPTNEYIFDQGNVRIIFLVLYTIVFCSCFFGNLMVILVVTLHWRMRSITNFCLANLAFADLCVGIFCVYQNIVTYLMDSWVFGEFMCKMYHFINCLSTTASVLILVVICIERYLAIIHPMTCKQIMTLNRLRITIVFVWILSAAISSPRFYYFSTISMPLPNHQYEILCLPNRTKYNSKLMDMISMTILFLIPLTVITILYTHIGIVLWKSSNNQMPMATPTPSEESSQGSVDYYCETDPNIIQTVNLTSLPLGTQQNYVQQSSRAGISSSSPLVSLSDAANKRSRSLLPTLISYLKIRNHHQQLSAKHVQSLENARMGNNCTRNATIMDRNLTSVGNGISTNYGVKDFIMNCKACHMHQPQIPLSHSSEILDGVLPCERIDEARQPCCSHHSNISKGNELCVIVPHKNTASGADGNSRQRSRDKATGSSMGATTTCCSRIPRPKIICLNEQNLPDKSVTFSASPTSPYCNRNCSCLTKTEPIVLVKFEKNKKQFNSSTRKSKCTIVMNRKSCHGSSSPASNGNQHFCSSGSSMDCTDGDSPRTISPSSPRFDSALCHTRKRNCCGVENCPLNINHCGTKNMIVGSATMRELCQNNSCTEHRNNVSVNFGISSRPVAMRRKKIDGSLCGGEQKADKGSGTAYVSSHAGCTEFKSSQLTRCAHHKKFPFKSPQTHFASTTIAKSHHLAGATTSSVPKRVRKLRLLKSSKYGSSALRSRRRIIRMLIVVVLAFTLCHLPFHARKVWQYWSPNWAPYQPGSVFSTLFTTITFLIMYSTSAINPLLYAFMSKNFQLSFKDLLCCRLRRSQRISRNTTLRSTHAVALSQAGL